MKTNREKALEALAKLVRGRADDRDTWLKVGMALHSVADDLQECWDGWSKQSEKYRPGECARQWRGFKRDRKITLGTLLHMAKEDCPSLPKPQAVKPRKIHATANKAQAAAQWMVEQDTERKGHDPEKVRFVRFWQYPRDTYRVLRFDLGYVDEKTGKAKKEFAPIHRNGNGWSVGDPPGELPLYRGDELPADGPIYVCEGEKATDAAREIGLPAVTSAHGSQSSQRADWQPLAGREIIILPDNDEEGRKYGEKVAAILTALGCTVRIVNLWEANHGE